MKKVFLVITAVFILSLIMGVIYWYQVSKDIKLFPTTGSKTTIGITPPPGTISPEPTPTPNDRVSRQHFCDSDSNCVPEPTCHSEICINQTYLGNYPDKSTLQCTEIFTPCEATPKSCLCQNGRCVNTRLDTPACMDYKEKIE